MQRLLNIFRAKANKVLDRAEDPRDSLDLSYEKQLENLQKIRRSVAEVGTARKRIEIQASQLEQQATKLQDQARQALGQNREDLAREALSRRAAIGAELTDLRTQQAQIADQEEKLVLTSQRLQSQVATFRTRKETMKATYTAAQAQARIGEAAAGISDSMGDAGMTIQRAQDKIADMQARAGAIDELLASGALTDLSSNSDDIQRQLDKVAGTSQVEAELAAMKTELAVAPVAGLPPGSPSPDAPSVDPPLVDAPSVDAPSVDAREAPAPTPALGADQQPASKPTAPDKTTQQPEVTI
jgi:phage shock protein A